MASNLAAGESSAPLLSVRPLPCRAVWAIALLLITPLLSACGRPDLGTAENPVVMYLVSPNSGPEVAAGGQQLAQLLADESGLAVEVHIDADAAAVRQAMGRGEAQVGWLAPVDYLLAHEWYSADVVLLAVRDGSTTYQGQVLVRADSGIRTLADLRGRTMCWSDRAALTDSVLAEVMLRANGLNPDRDLARNVTLASPHEVVLAVYDGTCDAGVTSTAVHEAVAADVPGVDEEVAILATTAAVPQEGVAFLPDVPAGVRTQVITALREVARSEAGRAALQAVCGVDDLKTGADSYYDTFRADIAEARINLVDLIGR